MNWYEPFLYSFMNEALLVAALVGAVCAVLSCYLVLKGWSLMGDAISHAVLPGVVVAYLVGLPLPVGAFASGLLCATATGWIKAHSRIKEDTVMGIVFTGLFALGLVMFSKVQSELHLNHILFGNVLGIERADMIQTLITAGVTLVILLLLRRDLLLFCFDPTHANAIGLNTRVIYYVFLSLLAATIVASMQAVGIILVVAMLVTPGCTARLLTDRFDRMLMLAAASSVLASCLGVYVSFFINGSTGACIVLAQALFFTVAFIFAPKHGLIAARRGVQRPVQ
ncbi:metal ABC transporter permease [Prosthecobacter dejongeii]|uniref:Manganese transport system permease protein/manganese/iron transport system permease protein n=1 Tax=Prosthecobacter dejongeii TaxID=48465 RepID=A0A7W7YPU7_9BACT|nr:metal ABC transporter permease [Prosthecobacter dejongeii]MBB5040178.1 manganese transport system permease protein/manganese/iron transport system permease protein [Prosthecobacter dejongeii]